MSFYQYRCHSSSRRGQLLCMGENAYVLNSQQGQKTFYRAKMGSTLPRYKAYLQWNATLPAVSMNFGGTQTAISNVVNSSTNAPIAVYGIDGRKCSTTQAKGGVYIVNGKKRMLKP